MCLYVLSDGTPTSCSHSNTEAVAEAAETQRVTQITHEQFENLSFNPAGTSNLNRI